MQWLQENMSQFEFTIQLNGQHHHRDWHAEKNQLKCVVNSRCSWISKKKRNGGCTDGLKSGLRIVFSAFNIAGHFVPLEDGITFEMRLISEWIRLKSFG